MEKLKNNFEHFLNKAIDNPALASQENLIIERFKKLYLSKNDFFVEEGKICPYFCYLETGILQHAITIDGEEITTYLALRNSVTSALKSFKDKIPSRKSIKAISDCSLWVIDHKNFHDLIENSEAFKTFYYNLIENQIYLIDDYRVDLLTLTPEERYKKMLVNEPTLLQEVPLHYLASFLGISTRHMSRIRKNII